MKLTLLLWLLLSGYFVQAQISRPPKTGKNQPISPAQTARPSVVYKDLVYRVDKSSMLVKIDELTDTEVIYVDPASPGGKKTLPRPQVWKVVFSDGSEEIITPVVEPVLASQPVSVSTTSQPNQSYKSPTVSGRYPAGNKAFSRFHITVGPEFAYYPSQVNNRAGWLNDSTGFGMKQNIGGSLRIDYQFLKPLAVSVTAGYYGWELVRKYTRDDVTEFSETRKLTRIPLQVGIKIYPAGGFYIMPEGGVNLLFASVKTSDTHPEPVNDSVRATPVTYGGSVGYEIKGKALLLDLSIRYQLMPLKDFRATNFTINETLNVASFRLGIGFNSPKRN